MMKLISHKKQAIPIYKKTIVIVMFLGKNPGFTEMLTRFLQGWRVYYCRKNRSVAIKRKVKGIMFNDGWHEPLNGKFWFTYWPYGII